MGIQTYPSCIQDYLLLDKLSQMYQSHRFVGQDKYKDEKGKYCQKQRQFFRYILGICESGSECIIVSAVCDKIASPLLYPNIAQEKATYSYMIHFLRYKNYEYSINLALYPNIAQDMATKANIIFLNNTFPCIPLNIKSIQCYIPTLQKGRQQKHLDSVPYHTFPPSTMFFSQ